MASDATISGGGEATARAHTDLPACGSGLRSVARSSPPVGLSADDGHRLGPSTGEPPTIFSEHAGQLNGGNSEITYDNARLAVASSRAPCKRARDAVAPPPEPSAARVPGTSAESGPHARPWERSAAAAAEFASFEWPLTELSEVRRLLSSKHLRPTWLMLGDSSTAWTTRMETDLGVIALVVDRRDPLLPCLCYRGSFHDVLELAVWDGVCAWPSCTHTAVSNANLLQVKALDGRTFFGIVGVLYALFAGRARARLVEQPVTVVGRYFEWPTTRLRTSAFGDTMDKSICLRLVGLELSGLGAYHRDPIGPLQARLPIWAFANDEERDIYRSAWSHFPLFLVALAACLAFREPPPPPTFGEAVERFAVAWHHAGLPVPEGYDAADGQPPTEDARAYQLTHGAGDGRRVEGVVPHSLRGALVEIEPAASPPADAAGGERMDPSVTYAGALRQLASEHMVPLAALTAQGFMLFFMSVMAQPLIYAPLSGLHVIGAELPVPLLPKRVALPVMEHWADVAWGVGTAATTFLIGQYTGGARLGVTTIAYTPPEAEIVRTPAALQRARRHRAFAWCTFAALALTSVADPAARAVAGVASFVRPVHRLADFQGGLHPFRSGARGATAMDPTPRLMMARTPTELLLERDAADGMLFRRAIEARARGIDGHLFDGWAEKVRPLEADVSEELAALRPDFSDPQLLEYPFSSPYVTPRTAPLPRAPLQPPRETPFCVTSPLQLLRPSGQERLRAWVGKIVDQLECIEKDEPNCELLRPHPIAIGQGALHPWARGIVWDLTFERAPCAVPLDFSLPIETGLKTEVLAWRLRHHLDQRLVSFLVEGVRFEADVELQTVLVPHLISLPKGFASVRKELYRLHERDWYRFFDHLPFWPMYLNGQGAAARKLSERYRRTTECGGPRKETRDETGLRALSINNASSLHHFPNWFATRLGDPAWEAWLDAKGLLDPKLHGTPRVLPPEVKPTIADVMRDISILLAAARLMGEPIYLFGDDARDHFNQLALSSEDWNKMGVVFLHDSARLEGTDASAAARIFFVSERRLGFGAKVSSNIAQRFSEAVLTMLGEDMDAAEAAQPIDDRPSAVEWRERRQRVADRLMASEPADLDATRRRQMRLWFAKMYTDDALLCVVGVERALRLIECWQRLVASIGLEMAPPEKRTCGTWVPWLGVLVCAGIGLIIVTKDKLLRTTERLLAVINEATEFSEYRALMGMLEHLRCINQAPSSVMYGLYAPHRSAWIRLNGPSTYVSPTPFMLQQLERWVELVSFTGGAVVTAALRGGVRGGGLRVVVSSDAATDSQPAGIGGYCHGLYWYLAIRPEWLVWLHITVLELLATGGSALAFEPHTRAAAAVVMQSDGLATPYVLTKHKTASDNMAAAHHRLLQLPAYRRMARRSEIAHLSGDCNPFADAVSRALWERFFALCRSISVRPVKIPAPPALVGLIDELVAEAQARGVRVRTSSYTKPTPVLPLAMLGLGRESPACEEADAVAIDSQLLGILQAAAGAPSARASVRGTAPAAPSTDRVDQQLLRCLRGEGSQPVSRKAAAPSSNSVGSAGSVPPLAGAGASSTTPFGVPVTLPHTPRDSTRISDELAAAIRGEAPANAAGVAPSLSKATGKRPRASKGMAPLTTETVAGLRLMALPTSRAGALTAARQFKRDALQHAARHCAAGRAEGMARAGFANTPHGIARMTQLLQHAVDISDFGASHSTRTINEAAWQHWLSFAAVIGFDPVFTVEQVRDYQSHIGTLLATFLLFVYPKMKGKSGRQWAKPRSAFAYVLAIIRIFREWKLVLPPAKVVKGELHGLLRSFVQVHGVAALMPRRREPFTFSMISTMQNVPTARLGARSYDAASPIGLAFRGILAVGWRTGHRLAEFVSHPSGELCYLTRGSITYVISGVVVSDPTRAQLLAMRPGDVVLIEPPRSKTDQFGEIHCPFPSSVPFRLDPNSAGHILRQQDLDHPCRGGARSEQPLFADEHGRPYTHAVMDTLLNHMLTYCFGSNSRHSWHSMRIGLATALKAASVPDDVIQMICRWMNPESLRAYARHGQSLHINSVDQAEHATIDAIQSASVPKVCNTEGNAALHLTFARSISARAQAVLDAADEAAALPPAAPPAAVDLSPLVAQTCTGRRVLVPATIYPTYTCMENGGLGWTALIASCVRGACGVRFLEARDPRGIPYADVQLQLAVLQPL